MCVVQKRRTSIVVAAIAAFAGLVVGALGASWFWVDFNARFNSYYLVKATEAAIVVKVGVLEQFRAGRPEDAIKALEIWLDGDLAGVPALARVGGTTLGENARRAVEIEMRARRVSGYEPQHPIVHAAVQKAFTLVQGSGDPDVARPGDHP